LIIIKTRYFMSYQNALTITRQNRKALRKLMGFYTIEQLNKIPVGFNNNIIWNCGHILSVQQMLTNGLANVPFGISNELVNQYAPGTKPIQTADAERVEDIKTMLIYTLEQLEHDIAEHKFDQMSPFMTALKFEINDLDSAVTFNQYHEALHMGHMLNISKFL
ncbi:MAG: DinB family protein, partial [Saprospiraceae bacterium]